MSGVDLNCRTCRFWCPDNGAGECRFNPPSVHIYRWDGAPNENWAKATEWPTTLPHHWCGKFQPVARGEP